MSEPSDPELESDDSFLREVAAAPVADEPLAAGHELGSYRIEEMLGRGGMGVVYRAQDRKLGREVAVKVLPSRIAEDTERRKRFLREARAAAQIKHDNIATVYEVGEDDDGLFIAMELVEGDTLRRRLERGGLGSGEAVRIVSAVAGALGVAHELGIVHRDIKPDNVMLTDGAVKVLDFGLAKQSPQSAVTSEGAPSTVATTEGHIMGTPGYMSPEQARGKAVDARTDIFALGVMLFEIASGGRPFGGATPLDQLAAITRDEAPHLDGEPDLDEVIQRCLQKDPNARYATCAELLEALDGVTLSTPDAISATDLSGRSVAPKETRSWGRYAIGALLIGVVGYAAIGGSRSPPASAPSASATTTATAVAKPVRLIDLPVRGTPKPEALEAYRAGITAMHGGGWAPAGRKFEEALRLDPDFPEAALRVAQIGDFQYGPEKKLEAIRYAVSLEARLSERDRMLLRILRAILLKPEPDRAEAARLMIEATKRFPMDAEFHVVVGTNSVIPNEQRLAFARRSVELDPDYADGWQLVANHLVRLGRSDEAKAPRDRCIETATLGIDCLRDRAMLHASEGRCEGWLEDVREVQVRAKAKHHLPRHALALASTDAPPEDIETLLSEDWATSPSAKALHEGLWASYRGRFDQAQASLSKVDLGARGGHRAAWALARLYIEVGDDEAAMERARAYLSKMRTSVERGTRYPNRDHRAAMQAIVARLSGDATGLDALRATLFDTWQRRNPSASGVNWWSAHLRSAYDAAGAQAALRKMPKGELPQEGARFWTSADRLRFGAASAELGRLYQLAGELDEAQDHFERAVGGCPSFDAPLVNVQVHLWRGQLFEAKKNTAAACAAYGRVLDHWGDAQPRSISADEARSRRRALDCADRAP